MAAPLPLHRYSRSPFLSSIPRIKSKTFSQNPNPTNRLAKFTVLCSSSSSWEGEEARWLREEQRWLREEQRWLREEARWREERERLLAEIGVLRMKLELLEKERLTDVEAVVTRPRPVLIEKASVKEMLLEEAVKVEETREVREVGVEEKKVPEMKKMEEPKRRSLRVGAEGDDVRAMQVCRNSIFFLLV
jgi:protein disulfide-isomerase